MGNFEEPWQIHEHDEENNSGTVRVDGGDGLELALFEACCEYEENESFAHRAIDCVNACLNRNPAALKELEVQAIRTAKLKCDYCEFGERPCAACQPCPNNDLLNAIAKWKQK